MLGKIRIKNFKSLRDVEMELQQVNLLIGPNNSGKTNLLKALEFFGKYYMGKYDDKDKFHYYRFRKGKTSPSHGILLSFLKGREFRDDEFIHGYYLIDDFKENSDIRKAIVLR